MEQIAVELTAFRMFQMIAAPALVSHVTAHAEYDITHVQMRVLCVHGATQLGTSTHLRIVKLQLSRPN
jgi:hypothetical protein